MNPILAWLAFGVDVLAILIWLTALSAALEVRRIEWQPGVTNYNEKRYALIEQRDKSIVAATLITALTAVLLVLAVVFK